MRPHTTPSPLLGLVTLLLAISVVAMHQLGAGHHLPASGSGHQSVALLAHDTSAVVSAVGHEAHVSTPPAGWCGPGCGWTEDETGGNAYNVGLLCLAVLPILLLSLLLTRGWRALTVLARWSLGLRAGKLTDRPGRAAPSRGSPEPLLLRLCVSRT